jgi:hypothetical protein
VDAGDEHVSDETQHQLLQCEVDQTGTGSRRRTALLAVRGTRHASEAVPPHTFMTFAPFIIRAVPRRPATPLHYRFMVILPWASGSAVSSSVPAA